MISSMCAYPGCSRAAEPGKRHCAAHAAVMAQKARDVSLFKGHCRRASAGWQRLYRTARWKRMRAAFLRENPLCAFCGRPATEADHIAAHRGDEALFFCETNLQPLCKGCHSRKTLAENGNFNKRRQK